MVPILVIIGAIAVVYFLGQSEQADAPGHCATETSECVRERLSYDAILGFAQNAGFDTDSSVAAAIAMAESGGDPNAYNPETQAGAPEGKGSYGLWQIYLHAHPEYEGIDLTDPQTNAEKAYEIYSKAGGFTPWSTFKSGVYQQFVQ